MRKLLSASLGVCLLLAGAAPIYTQVWGPTPFTVHIFALGGLLATVGIAWMFLDLAGPEGRPRKY